MPVPIKGEVRGETRDALRFFDGRREGWIPKSLIAERHDDWDSRLTLLEIRTWFAEKDGWV